MKKLMLILATAAIAGLSTADIQAPPAEKHGVLRKLSRAVSNIVYGVAELPTQWVKSEFEGGTSEQAGYGTVYGAGKTLARLGFGVYELVTFPVPTYKGTFRAPYPESIREATHPQTGFFEFPPEVGFISGTQINRYSVY
jgi:putative exosortase-associated protein (TIGR04073 family)